MKIIPLHEEFAAEICGIDLASIADAEFSEVDHAINQYSLLLVRDQKLDDERQIAFSARFGALEEDHVSYYSSGEIRYIGKVGNIDHLGKKLESEHRGVRSQTGNEMWHSDSSFREIPSLHSLLYAYEVPDQGGDTEFVSGRAAYRRLDSNSRNRIDKLVGIHDYIFSRTKVSEDAVSPGQRTFMRPVRQRLVRQNPVTGEKNLYLGSHLREIENWSIGDSRELIERLTAETTRAESVYRHKWRSGDLLIWDNRCILHRGCGYDADRYRRRLHQTRVRGAMPSLAEARS